MGLTIRDIARKAGVSIATVSRVLNDSKPVSPELKERVLGVVRETGFKPNALARGLIKKETGLIGVVIPDIARANYASMIKGVMKIANPDGFELVVSISHGVVKRELEILNDFREKQLEGIILSGVSYTDDHRYFFDTYQLPAVIAAQNVSQLNLPAVNIDNFQAAYRAVYYLLELGHRRIAMITGPLNDTASGLDRYRGYTAAVKEYGLKETAGYLQEGDLTLEGGYRLMEKLLQNNPTPTAVFAAADKMAVGAMNCCYDQGLKIPRDISIIGFDDSEIAAAVRPTLTTIHKNDEDIGAAAVRLLLKRIKGSDDGIWNVNLPCQLIVRDSTAVPGNRF